MPNQEIPTRYGAVAQAFHWVIAALIVTQFALGHLADDLPLGAHKLELLARHKSFGMTVLMLAILRLLWRLKNPPPALPPGHDVARAAGGAQHSHRVLRAAVRDAAHRLDDVLRQELLGQLVWTVHLAESHRQESKRVQFAANDAPCLERRAASRSPCCIYWPRSNIISGTRTTCCCACCRSPNRRGDRDESNRDAARCAGGLPVRGLARSGATGRRARRSAMRRIPARAAWNSRACRPARNSRASSINSPPSSISRRTRLADARFDVADRPEFAGFDGQGSRQHHARRRHLRCRALSDRPLRDSQFHQDRGGLYRRRRADAARRHQGRCPSIFNSRRPARGAKLSGTAKLKRLDFGVGQGDWKSTKSVADDVNVAFALVLKPAHVGAARRRRRSRASANRQFPRFLHGTQREARLHPGHVRQAREMLAVQALEIRGIGEHHPQQIIVFARHEIALHDLRAPCGRPLRTRADAPALAVPA